MPHIRRKIEGTPSPTNRMAYIVVITTDWAAPLEDHPKVLEHPDLYEVTNDDIPTDTTIWSIEYENNQ
jgi:hypothetical protein